MARSALLLVLLALAGCAMQPLPSHLMQADRKIYQQTEGDAYLARKIQVESVTYAGNNSMMASAFNEAKLALSDSLAIGGYLASEKNARYSLTAVIKDVQTPRCFFGSCETGAAIDYTLTDIKSEKIVYNDLLVVPYTKEYSIFTEDVKQVQKEAIGGAIGENFAHLIHVLHMKKQSDL